ncbi:MAG: MATE family efflux transporter [Clostridia bacterium]
MDAVVRLTEGSTARVLIKYSIPFILTGVFQSLFNVTDLVVAGHYLGDIGSTGIGIGGQLLYLITNAAIGISAGGTILAARHFGKKEGGKALGDTASLIVINIVISLLFTAVLLFFSGAILKLLKTPAPAYQIALDYVRVSGAGLVFLFVFNAIIAIIRGAGDSKFPLYITIIACLINAGLDILFVGHMGLGGTGAALAGIGANALALILSLIYAKKKKLITLTKDIFKKLHSVKDILKLGIPIALLNMTAAFSFMGLTFLVNTFAGDDALYASAAHSIAARYNGFAVLPARGMSGAIAAITSQNIGAGKYARNKPTLLVGLAVTLVGGLALFAATVFFPEHIFRIFGASPEVIAIGKSYMRALGFDYLLLPFAVCGYGITEGFGKTKVTMAINNIGSAAVRLPIAFVLSRLFSLGLLGIGLSIPIASLFCSVVIWIYIIAKRLLKTKAPAREQGQIIKF